MDDLTKGKIIAIDIDGVITNEPHGWDYENKTPNTLVINQINLLYQQNTIVLFTARDIVDEYVTKKQMKEFGVKYHSIIFGKPKYDYIVDDKGVELWEI